MNGLNLPEATLGFTEIQIRIENGIMLQKSFVRRFNNGNSQRFLFR